MIVYCATTNPGKLREFSLAATPKIRFEALPRLSEAAVPEETGRTFEENAILKARYYGPFTPGYLVAEDSGLEVDALGGAPGIYSARYAGDGASDEANNRKLLAALNGVETRAARYVCSIALVYAAELVRTFRGTVEGSITTEPRGSGGFGYDPLFFYPGFGCTFAEVSKDRKQSVSHRGDALSQLIAFLQALPAEHSRERGHGNGTDL